MLETLLSSFVSLMTPATLLWLLFGTAGGLILGAIPGLAGGLLTIAVLPLTYTMETPVAMALLIAIFIGSCTGSMISSVLLGIPGTPNSIPTVWDGYEFTKQGDPVRPLSVATVCNFVGTVPSIIVAMFACFVVARWAIKLGPWEYFSLCFLAIAMVIALAKENLRKGIISAGLAFLFTMIGSDPVSGIDRFAPVIYMRSGLSVVCMMMGVFATYTMMMEFVKDTKRNTATNVKVSRFRWPGKDLKDNLGTMIRSFFMGLFIGFLPGLGGDASAMLAYEANKKLAKDGDKWGHGAIGGVIAAETANNACCGGVIIPMIALGIPGNGAMVYLIAALAVHGISAGPRLISNQPEVVYAIYAAALIAAVIGLIIEVVCMPVFPRLMQIPYHFFYPIIIGVCFIGAYLSYGNCFGLVVMLAACLVGLGMRYFDIPAGPFMMSYILSGMLEENFRRAMTYSQEGIVTFFTRPLSCALLILSVLIILWNVFGDKLLKKKTLQGGSEQ